jgi:hypothetical protein
MRELDIKTEMEFLNTFSGLARSLQEISVMKMKSVRDYVLRAREFKDGLSGVYKIVKASEQRKLLSLPVQQRSQDSKTNGKKAIVLLSANQRMFGSITQEVFEQFVWYISQNDDDIIVIGKIGKSLYESYGITKPYTYFDLKDMDIAYIDLLPVISHLLQYTTINVFYGSYTSIFVQQPTMSNVTGDTLFTKNEDLSRVGRFRLEPSIDSLKNFFSGQIIGLLFRQAAYEYELSRHASRIQALEQSMTQAEIRHKKQKLLLSKLHLTEGTKKQLQSVVYLKRNR